jgi:hypothetical protein
MRKCETVGDKACPQSGTSMSHRDSPVPGGCTPKPENRKPIPENRKPIPDNDNPIPQFDSDGGREFPVSAPEIPARSRKFADPSGREGTRSPTRNQWLKVRPIAQMC